MAIVRPEQPGDEAEIAAIHRAAFPDSTEADLVERLRGSDAWVPELSIVVQQEDQLVAHVLLSRVTAGDTENALALGPVAVLPIHQRGGLGTAMVRMAVDRAKTLDFDGVVVIGIPAFFENCGFEPAAARGLTTEMDVPGEAFRVVELKPGGITPGPVMWPDEWDGTGV